MSKKPYLKEKILFGNYALIKSTNNETDFSCPVYAINWFNTNPKWIYNLYNFLAARSVFKVGGTVFFKGEVIKTFQGKNVDARDMLLIVNYPSVFNFLELIKNRYFQLVSIFRILAVRKFTFGFTERLDCDNTQERTSLDQPKAYAIIHFKSEQPLSHILPLFNLITESNGIKVHYAGQISSLLYSGNKSGKETQMDCLLDGIILLKNESYAGLEAIMSEVKFQELINQFNTSYIALLKRTL